MKELGGLTGITSIIRICAIEGHWRPNLCVRHLWTLNLLRSCLAEKVKTLSASVRGMTSLGRDLGAMPRASRRSSGYRRAYMYGCKSVTAD
jgi:hypothetical protein